MMAEKIRTNKNKVGSKSQSVSESKKLKDLKIELLKSPTKRGRIKKEIARLLTMGNLTKSEDKA